MAIWRVLRPYWGDSGPQWWRVDAVARHTQGVAFGNYARTARATQMWDDSETRTRRGDWLAGVMVDGTCNGDDDGGGGVTGSGDDSSSCGGRGCGCGLMWLLLLSDER